MSELDVFKPNIYVFGPYRKVKFDVKTKFTVVMLAIRNMTRNFRVSGMSITRHILTPL